MEKVEIKMLGAFEILVDGRQVLTQLSQSRKATALVQYLVLQRGARVPHKTLTDALWGGERSANPDMALRAILHRFRNMIAQENLTILENCILTSRGCYQWNPELPCEVDVFQMQDLVMQAGQEKDPQRRLELEEQIVAIYRGRLLPLSADEPWVESSAVRLHVLYRAAMIHVLEQYKKDGDNERLVALCRSALEKNPRADLSGADHGAGNAGPPGGGPGGHAPGPGPGQPAPCGTARPGGCHVAPGPPGRPEHGKRDEPPDGGPAPGNP